MKYTDPSGYFFKKLVKKIKRFVKKYWRAIVAVAISVVTAGALSGVAALWAKAAITFAGGFAAGMVTSGGDLRAAMVGGLTAVAMMGIGELVTMGRESANLSWANAADRGRLVAKVSMHGAVSGTASKAQGGKFADGFYGSAFSAAASPWLSNNVHTETRQILGAAIIGGTASAVGGGKFANGAVFGAMSYAFNWLNSRAATGKAARAKADEMERKAKEYAMQRVEQEIAESQHLESLSQVATGTAAGCAAVAAAPCVAIAGKVALVSDALQITKDAYFRNYGRVAEGVVNAGVGAVFDRAGASAAIRIPGPAGNAVNAAMRATGLVVDVAVPFPGE